MNRPKRTWFMGIILPVVLCTLLLSFAPQSRAASPPAGTDSFSLSYSRPADTLFAELKDKLDASYVFTQGGWLCFKYPERYETSAQLDYSVYDNSHQELSFSPTPATISKRYGMNWVRVYLPKNNPFTKDHIYILEVTHTKGEKQYLRFRYDF